MRYIKTISFMLLISFIFTLEALAETKWQKVQILENYLQNLNSINEFQIETAVDKTITCLELAESEVASKADDIYKSAKKEKKTIFYFALSKKIPYCPDLRISITDDYLVPEGHFSEGLISLSYNFVRECKKSKKFGLIPSVKCDKNSLYIYLNHEFTHYAFSLLYGNMKFRDIIFNESEQCKCKRQKCKNFIKSLAVERRFFDEFPPTYFSYYINFNKNCSPSRNSYYKFKDKFNFLFYYSLNDYKECVLNGSCDIYKVYILGEKLGRDTNICVGRRDALKAILDITIAKEKEIFAPKVRKLIRILRNH